MEEQKTYNDAINEILSMLKEITEHLKQYGQNMINRAAESINRLDYKEATEFLEAADRQSVKVLELTRLTENIKLKIIKESYGIGTMYRTYTDGIRGVLSECNINTNFTDFLLCPCCGHAHDNSWAFFDEWGITPEESRVSNKYCICHVCRKKFLGTEKVTIQYSSEKIKEVEII